MVEPEFSVNWNGVALRQLRNIYEYIFENSPQNARKVITEIVEATEKLSSNPDRFGLDKYKRNNDGSYRYFEIYRYRIVFRIINKQVQILRVRSTDQEPLAY